jgi:predicted Zn-dependent peptidase
MRAVFCGERNQNSNESGVAHAFEARFIKHMKRK